MNLSRRHRFFSFFVVTFLSMQALRLIEGKINQSGARVPDLMLALNADFGVLMEVFTAVATGDARRLYLIGLSFPDILFPIGYGLMLYTALSHLKRLRWLPLVAAENNFSAAMLTFGPEPLLIQGFVLGNTLKWCCLIPSAIIALGWWGRWSWRWCTDYMRLRGARSFRSF